MLNAKSFLAVDFGAANLKMAEFQLTEGGGLLLKRYGFKSLGQEGTIDTTREGAIQKALQELLAEQGASAKTLNLCAPGFHTFSKFVKLPPVDTTKVTQIIQYEAQQNVPFPLEEVVWDYQILGAAPTGELEVLLVAIKSDIVEGLFRTCENAGLRLQLVDVSPAALCNAFRYNYSDLEGCSMLLDIGAKTSNLLFFEKGNVYSRGINIGANAITQEFARESKLSFAEAERLKLEQGFVSLGGAYEEPDSPLQAAVSKIARQVLTRLHIQVNQTIQFYRGQQGGSAPQRLFLSGGASIMPYAAQFFSEKLNLAPDAVEYLNPFRHVQIDEEVNREELAKVAHNLGEVVGLGLRNLAHCPVELNLMPESSRRQQLLNQKKPYFIASAACAVLALFAMGGFFGKLAEQKEKDLVDLERILLNPMNRDALALKREMDDRDALKGKLDQLSLWLEDRFYWVNLLGRLREVLMAVEKTTEQQLNTKTGIWIERMQPVLPPGVVAGALVPQGYSPVYNASASPASPLPAASPSGRSRRGAGGGGGAMAPQSGNPASSAVISNLVLHCRAVNVAKSTGEPARTEIADAVVKELRGHPDCFDPSPEGTKLSGEIRTDADLTFTFEVTLKLKRPVKIF
jgi:type IV pilus assembly protein PilM